MAISISATNDGLSGQVKVNGVPMMNFGADTSGQLSLFRNRLINGDFRVTQRPTGTVVANTWVFGDADRTLAQVQGTTASGTVARISTAEPSSQFALAVTATTTGQTNILFQQRVEDINCFDLNGSSVTVSAMVAHNLATSCICYISLTKPVSPNAFSSQSGVTGNPSTAFVIPPNVATKISYTFTLGADEASYGLAPWVIFQGTGAVTSKIFWIGDFQMEKGSIATPFEIRPIGIDRMLARRYYERSDAGYYGTYFNGKITSNGSTFYSQPYRYMTAKRIVPNVTFTNVGAAGFSSAVGSVFNNTVDSVAESRVATSTHSSGIFGSVVAADAEL